MLHDLTKLYEGEDLAVSKTGVLYLPIVRAGTLKEISISTIEAQVGDAIFTVLHNGNEIQELTILDGETVARILGLDAALADGDEFILNLNSGDVFAPVTLNLVVDDGQTGGSGGGSDTPDTTPETPTTYDDEFTGEELDEKWTTNNAPVIVFENGVLRLTETVNNTAEMRSILQDISGLSGGWKFRAKCALLGSFTGNYAAGLIARETASGKFFTFNMNRATNTIQLGGFDGANNGSFTQTGVIVPTAQMYLEIEYAAPHLIYKYSFDGKAFYALGSFDVDSFFTTSGVGFVGLFIWGFGQAGHAVGAFEWFRKVE